MASQTTMTELPPRPYTKVKGSEPSVTTILGAKNTPGLDWAAAKLTAEYAVLGDHDSLPVNDAEAIDHIRKHFRGIWDGRAYMGTLTHAVNESWVHGTPIDIEALVMAHQPWEKIADEKLVEALGYVDGLEKWWSEQKPTEIRTEEVIRKPDQYIGTRDMVCTLNGQRWLLDIKTTNHKEPEKGIYGDSWALQLAAYRHASEVVTYGWGENDKGKPVVVEVSHEPNELVDRCGIVHLRGDGEYQFYEVQADIVVYDVFLSVLHLYDWSKSCPKPTLLNKVVVEDV